MSRTAAVLRVSRAAFDEIVNGLRAAGYDHAIDWGDGTRVDMDGIWLQIATDELVCPKCDYRVAAAGCTLLVCPACKVPHCPRCYVGPPLQLVRAPSPQ